MKKLMTVGAAAVMAAGLVNAQNDIAMVGQAPANDSSQTLVTFEADLVSSYVWRGQVINNDFAFQPQLTASQYGLSLSAWANYDIGENNAGVQNDFSEIDLSLGYTLPMNLDDVSFDIGLINYSFPANGTYQTDANGNEVTEGSKSTTELFLASSLLTFKDYVIPSVTIYGDIDEAEGVYVLFDIYSEQQLSDYLWVVAGISAGWGNTSYNDYYWGTKSNNNSVDKGFNDYNFYASCSYEAMDNVTVSVSATYTMLEGGTIENAAHERYEAKEKFWGGISIAYDF